MKRMIQFQAMDPTTDHTIGQVAFDPADVCLVREHYRPPSHTYWTTVLLRGGESLELLADYQDVINAINQSTCQPPENTP
jgi:hypothetical protein